jgi:hypothetical protein
MREGERKWRSGFLTSTKLKGISLGVGFGLITKEMVHYHLVPLK